MRKRTGCFQANKPANQLCLGDGGSPPLDTAGEFRANATAAEADKFSSASDTIQTRTKPRLTLLLRNLLGVPTLARRWTLWPFDHLVLEGWDSSTLDRQSQRRSRRLLLLRVVLLLAWSWSDRRRSSSGCSNRGNRRILLVAFVSRMVRVVRCSRGRPSSVGRGSDRRVGVRRRRVGTLFSGRTSNGDSGTNERRSSVRESWGSCSVVGVRRVGDDGS